MRVLVGLDGPREAGHRIQLHELPAERLQAGDGIDELCGYVGDDRVVVLDGASNTQLVCELDHPGRGQDAHVVGHRTK